MIDALLSNPLIALFAIIASGMLLGQVRFWSVTFGSSAVLFVALIVGMFHYRIPEGLGTLGLVLFVYCIGITAGPSFFRAFVRQGKALAKLAVVMVGVAALVTVVAANVFGIDAALALGLFAGAMTSTPGLAAAMETFCDPESQAIVSVGYGVAYPFGVVGVVLFVQLMPRFTGSADNQPRTDSSDPSELQPRVVRQLVQVTNSSLFGKKLMDVPFLATGGFQIARVLQGERLVPLGPDLVLEPGQRLLVVADRASLSHIVDFLGKKSNREFVLDTDRERMFVVVSSPRVIRRTLGELDLLRRFGVVVTRITRHDLEFVPGPDTVVYTGDTLWVVGDPDSLKRFADEAGHQAKLADQTDIISLAVGILAGIVLGMIPITLPGGQTFSLGLAGGPLFVSLLLGHIGQVGRITGHIPRASRLLMMEIGLVFFLANAGVCAGDSLAPVLREHGVVLLLAGAFVTIVPMVVGYQLAVRLLGLSVPQALGGMCGGMTSSPGLGALTANTQSRDPVVGYAAAYPVALIVTTIAAQLLGAILM